MFMYINELSLNTYINSKGEIYRKNKHKTAELLLLYYGM